MKILSTLFSSIGLIKKLSVNDFKAKFSGSYFGILWAFMQPIVTVMIYVFVFQVGFRAGETDNGYPYVLWLIAGIVPWFFFSEALTNATNCLLEYSYLVKKVVFKIDILPVVKIISSLFIHIFFIAFAILIYLLNGRMLPVQFIQIIYYMFACICLVFSLSYLTSSIVPFFRDFTQIVNILLQIGMWMCPIMWNENILLSSENYFINTILIKILKLNPMYYIVKGYRDCFMGGQDSWLWQNALLTIYFWVIVILLFVIGQKFYNKFKVHFPDVL